MSVRSHEEERAVKRNKERIGAKSATVWIGRFLSGLVVLFMLMDAVMKLIRPTPSVVAASGLKLGYPVETMFGIGLALLACTVLYAIPRTAVLGAILLTGYLGGAVSTHVRVQDGAFNILFPVIFGAMVWGGLFLRDGAVRALIPLRR